MDDLCKTKYPILFVHGAGFRDLKWPVYWGRIPSKLHEHGAQIYYGLQDSWGCIENNAEVLLHRIYEILYSSGCGKVNIIAHSKGGLEARMAASSFCGDNVIASITTIGTPHHGSKTIDHLLQKSPKMLFNIAAFAVNNWIRVVGDKKPDFLKVCEAFSTAKMAEFNKQNPDVPGVFYQSFAGVMKSPLSDINLTTANLIVNRIEGANDGLVSVASASWGENTHIICSNSNRGISHLDEIDFRRMPFTKKFGDGVSDICSLYIDIVKGLKQKGF